MSKFDLKSRFRRPSLRREWQNCDRKIQAGPQMQISQLQQQTQQPGLRGRHEAEDHGSPQVGHSGRLSEGQEGRLQGRDHQEHEGAIHAHSVDCYRHLIHLNFTNFT